MSVFGIRLFGELEIRSGEDVLPPLASRADRHLLAFLAINRSHAVSREKAAGTLWRDVTQEQARKTLRNSLWRIRTLLAEAGQEDAVEADRDHLRLNPRPDWVVDLWEFEDRLAPLVQARAEVEDEADVERIQEAVDLHRRPFLEGEDAFWCDSQRSRTRLMWLTGIEALVRYHRRHERWSQALLLAHLALRVDPLREPMHREVIYCHYRRGDRPSALAQYEGLADTLREELGIGPMESTRELRQSILTNATVEDPHSAGEPGDSSG